MDGLASMCSFIAPIDAIYWLNAPTEDDYNAKVGECKCTKITAYREIDGSIWLAVYREESIYLRLPAQGCCVVYKAQKPGTTPEIQ